MCEEGQEENRAYESNERTQGEQRRGIVAQSSFEDPSKEQPQPLHDTALFLREQRQAILEIDKRADAVWLAKYAAVKMGDTHKTVLNDSLLGG